MGDSGASMHMLSKSDLSSEEMETLRRSRSPTVVVTADGEVQTNEEAKVYVHDLGLFVTVQLLEDTVAVLSLGKSAKNTDTLMSGSAVKKPRLTKDGKEIICKTDNFVSLVVPGLSSSSGTSSSSTSASRDLSSSGAAAERRDDPAPGNWSEDKPSNPNPKIKRGMTIEIRTTVCEIFLNGWRSAQTI